MLVKYAQIPVISPDGTRNVWNITPGVGMDKTAGFQLLPEVDEFIQSLKPRDDGFYVLVNAMGAGEYWGSNLNGDFFPEASLCHKGDDYGYRTFYDAHVFKHHVNKDPAKSFGDVVFSAWNPQMRRVELVLFVDRDRAQLMGATDIYDKIDAGDFMAVSMGCRVKYDLCSICLDRQKYQKAKESYNPMIHKSVEDAVLAFHKKDPIKGLARTRAEYCIHAKTMMNRIFPDGRKVYVINDFPKFFDISFVYIGADKTARVMAKVGSAGMEETMAKVASLNPSMLSSIEDSIDEKDRELIKAAEFGPNVPNRAVLKKLGSILKNISSEYVHKIIPAMERQTKPLPENLMEKMMDIGLPKAVGFSIRHRFILRPDEFQRLALRHLGHPAEADHHFIDGTVFSPSQSLIPCPVSFDGVPNPPEHIDHVLPELVDRVWDPQRMTRRVIIIRKRILPSSGFDHPFGFGRGMGGLFDRVGGMYNSYRQQMFDLRPRGPHRFGLGPMLMMSRMFGPTTRRQMLVIKLLIVKPETIYDMG